MGAPVVTPIGANILLNQSVLASTLFSVIDPDGDPITQYRFTDLSNAAFSGFFRLNGVSVGNGTTTTINAAQLGQLTFVSGSQVSTENVRIEAFANGQWSTPADALFYFVTENNRRPIVTGLNSQILQDEYTHLSSLLSASDPDGYPIQHYFVRDQKTGNGSGYLVLDGVKQAQGVFTRYTADEFSRLTYYPINLVEKERLEVFAWDGAMMSAYAFSQPTIRANASPPTAIFGQKIVRANRINSFTELAAWNDPDGSTIKWLDFMDTNSSPDSGSITRNGNPLAPNVWHRVSLENLGTLEFMGGNPSGAEVVDNIRYRVWDGRHLSNESSLQMKTRGVPDFADMFFHETSLWFIPATTFVERTDNGAAISKYEFIDLSTDPRTGRFQFGTTPLTAGVVHEVTASQLPQLRWRTGAPDLQTTDSIRFRGWNGSFWSSWASIDIKTEPNYRHAIKFLDNPFNLLSMEANDWNDWLRIIDAPRSVLTYSFVENWDGGTFDGATEDNFSRFTPAQISMAREAFRQVSEFANIEFIEVPDSSFNAFAEAGFNVLEGGIIRMSNYANPDGEAAAYAGPPGLNDFAGDIKMNIAFTSTTLAGTRPGTRTYETFIHELGHVLGLKHPHEGNPLLLSNDNPINTVMSYVPNTTTPGANYHSSYDVISIQDLYGPNMTTRTEDTLYDIAGYFGGNANWMGTIWDAGGIDTISAVGAAVDSVIDLREGGRTSFGSFGGTPVRDHIAVAFNAKIENAIGSSNNDILFGNYLVNRLEGGAGDDELHGFAGDDMLMGGAGNDEYFVGFGYGNNTINEDRMAGRDRITIASIPGFTNFTESLQFRRLGRDLVIDLMFDGEIDSTQTIKDQAWGGSRIETINFGGVNVDLAGLFANTTSSPQSFTVGTTSTIFGFVAQPVV